VHEAADDRPRGRVAEHTAAPRVGARRDLAGGTALSKPLLDTRLTDPKERRAGALGAAPLIIGAQHLRSKVTGGSFHARPYRRAFPYMQMRTALRHEKPSLPAQMSLLSAQRLHSFHHVRVAGEPLEGGCLIGLPQGTYRDLLGLEIGALPPRQGILQVTPASLTEVKRWIVGRQLHAPYMGWPPKVLGGMRSAVIQAAAIHAGGEGLGGCVHSEWEGLRRHRRLLQKTALADGRRDLALDRKPVENRLDGPQGWDPVCRAVATAPRQPADPTVIVAADAPRVGRLRRPDARPWLLTAGLQRWQRIRGLWCDGGAGPYAWP
jgi:hypothetical protein